MSLCGQLLVGGFAGTTLPTSFAQALARGERAGAILFGRNVEGPAQVAALNEAIVKAAAEAPLIGVDQEGGRVARLKAPFLRLPPMRALGEHDDVVLTEAAGRCLGRQLAAFGFSVDFAPVMDVDSNPDNPVIGDRSFGSSPTLVAAHGVAFARGLGASGVAGCAKHFPGHGDTATDSHHALPVVDRPQASLEEVELPPFRAAVDAGVPAIMSAHVVFPVWSERPATFTSDVLTTLLRTQWGYQGVVFTDDLEMAGAAAGGAGGEVAVAAVAAGCDQLLVCSDASLQDACLEALTKEHEASAAFRARVAEAVARSRALRARFPARVASPDARAAILGDVEARRIEGLFGG